MKPPLFLLQQQVVITAFAGNDSFGEKVYTTLQNVDASVIVSSTPNGEVTIRCRFEPTVNTDRQPEKQQNRYVATLFTLGTDIPTQSRVVFEDRKYIVSECIKHYDIKNNDISYLEVLLS